MEAVLLDVPLESVSQVRPDNLQWLVDVPGLRLLASPRFFHKFDSPMTWGWERDYLLLDQAKLSRMSFVFRHGQSEHAVIELGLGFSLPNNARCSYTSGHASNVESLPWTRMMPSAFAAR